MIFLVWYRTPSTIHTGECGKGATRARRALLRGDVWQLTVAGGNISAKAARTSLELVLGVGEQKEEMEEGRMGAESRRMAKDSHEDGRVGTAAPLWPCHRIDPALLDQARVEMERDGVPGVALGVYHDGDAAAAGLGVTNLRHPQPVDRDTMFQLCSITKTFTVTAMLQLVEQGRVGLDDPVRSYLPGFAVADPEVSRAVTIRHLMTHSCGWEGDFFPDT